MDFDIDEDQMLLRDLVERFAADRCPLADRPRLHVPDGGFDPANWALLAEIGLLGVALPEASGGLGGGPVEIMVMMEALGRGLVPEPVFATTVVAARILAALGGGEQEALLAQVVAGTAHPAFAWAEPMSRFALDRPACRGGETVTGVKTFVTGGTAATHFLVSARDDDGVAGVWLVDASAPGITRRAYRTLDGLPALELGFVDVPARRLPGDFAALAAAIDGARLAACAEMVGIMQTLLDTTVDYLKTRHQFGVAIGSFQNLQHRAVDLYVLMELSRSHLYAATAAAAGKEIGLPQVIAGAKAFIARSAITLGEECIQMHGGMGVTDELIIGHGHKRLLVLASLFGDSDHELRRYQSLAA